MADSSLAASMAAAIGQIITATGDTVTFNAHTYTAGRSILETERQYDPLGEMEGYRETYTFLQSALTANSDTPAVGGQITTPDGVRRILRIRRDGSFDTMQRLDVGDLY